MSESPLFAFSADLHLRPHAWAKRPGLSGDSYESLRQLVRYCLANGCPLLLGGDIFDQRRPDPMSVGQFCQQISRLPSAGCLYIQGDHDYSATMTWPALSVCAIHQHEMLLELGPFKIYGLDWTPTDMVEEALAKIPEEANTLFTHLSWAEIQTIGQTQAVVANLPPNITTLFTGDYHVHLSTSILRPGQPAISVFSPGSTCMQAIDEPAEKQFWTCSRNDLGHYQMQSELLRTRVAARYRLDTPEEFEAWVQEVDIPQIAGHCVGLLESIQAPIFRIQYNDAIPDAHDRIHAKLAGHDVHLFEDPYHTFVEQSVEMGSEEAFNTLAGAVHALADDDNVARSAIRLLESDDPAAEISVMQGEFQREYQSTLPQAADAAAPETA